MGTIVDDRGEPYELPDLADTLNDPRMGDPRFRAAHRRAWRAASLSVVSASKWGTTVGVMVALFLVFSRFVMPSAPDWFRAVALILIVSVISRVVWRYKKRRATDWHSGLLLSDGLCPGCLYTIGTIDPDEDGFTVCPECGSSWRNDRIVRRIAYEETPAPSKFRLWLSDMLSGDGFGPESLADDRGHPGIAIDPRLRSEIRFAESALRDRLVAASKHMCSESEAHRMVLGGAVIVAALGLCVWALWPPNSIIEYLWLGITFFAVPFGVGMMRSGMGVKETTVRTEMLHECLCPRCAADLRELEPEEDGCVICAECGAAWRLDPEESGDAEPGESSGGVG